MKHWRLENFRAASSRGDFDALAKVSPKGRELLAHAEELARVIEEHECPEIVNPDLDRFKAQLRAFIDRDGRPEEAACIGGAEIPRDQK